MGVFRTWLEDLELDKTTSPDERYKHIWVSDPNNPQQIDYWKRQNTKQVFRFPLAKDRFVHFTLADSAPLILADKEIKTNPAYGVSLSFGMWFPVVQFNHIISKKIIKDKAGQLMPPIILRNKPARQRAEKIGGMVPDFGQDIVAIVFQTDKLPHRANKEEVVWEAPLPLKNVQSIHIRDAIRMLKNTPYKDVVRADDSVNHI